MAGSAVATPTPIQRALGRLRWPVIGLAFVASLLFYLPFLVVVAASWTARSFVGFPPQGFSLQWYTDVLGDPAWMDAFVLSLWISAVAALVAVALGTLGALALARVVRPGAQRLLRTMFIIPLAVPPVAYAVGLNAINSLSALLRQSVFLLIAGEALLALPYVFVLVSTGLAGSDPAMRAAASTLGANWPMIVRRIELPAVLPNILGGALFAFAVIFDEVVLAVFLTPAGVKTLPLQMFTASQEAFSPQLTAAATMVSLLAVLVLAGATALSARRRPRETRDARKAVAA